MSSLPIQEIDWEEGAGDSPPTVKFAQLANAKQDAMIAEGRAFYHFGGGDSSGNCYSGILARLEAAKGALKRLPYPKLAGRVELLRAYANSHQFWGVSAPEVDELMVGSGAKDCIAQVYKLVAKKAPNSKVLVLLPCYPSFLDPDLLAGLTPVTVDLDIEDGTPWQDRLKAGCGDNISAVVLNQPRNPDGEIWPAEKLEEFWKIVDQNCPRKPLLISDEVYRMNVYPGVQPFTIRRFLWAPKNRTVDIFSVSKAFKAAGLQIGLLRGSRKLIGMMADAASRVRNGVCEIGQHAAVGAFEKGGFDFIEDGMRTISSYAEIVATWASKKRKLKYKVPRGTNYFSLDLSELIAAGDFPTTAAFSMAALELGVAVMYGEPFGKPLGRFNLAQVASEDDLRAALNLLVPLVN